MSRARAALVTCALSACDADTRASPLDRLPAAQAAAAAPVRRTTPPLPPGYVKGQLHAHTGRSGDSRTPPDVVHAWYEARGYDFIVFTDHNTVTDTLDTALLTIPGVELTQNLRTCDPPPRPGDACLLHVNALFVSGEPRRLALDLPQGGSRTDLYGWGIDRSGELGGLAMLNHPNMHYGADAGTLIALAERGLTLIEVGNQSWDSENAGDADHPPTEALWDAVLSKGHRVWGTVTDDAHHYDDVEEAGRRGERVYVGDLGFVVVRASKEPSSIRAALERGHFYGSTGLIFSEVELGRERCRLSLAGGARATFEVIGEGGRVLERTTGDRLDLTPPPTAGRYVRFRVRAPSGAMALTQPVFL